MRTKIKWGKRSKEPKVGIAHEVFQIPNSAHIIHHSFVLPMMWLLDVIYFNLLKMVRISSDERGRLGLSRDVVYERNEFNCKPTKSTGLYLIMQINLWGNCKNFCGEFKRILMTNWNFLHMHNFLYLLFYIDNCFQGPINFQNLHF